MKRSELKQIIREVIEEGINTSENVGVGQLNAGMWQHIKNVMRSTRLDTKGIQDLTKSIYGFVPMANMSKHKGESVSRLTRDIAIGMALDGTQEQADRFVQGLIEGGFNISEKSTKYDDS